MKLRILMPLELPCEQEPSFPLLKILSASSVILLGYVKLPSQTCPEEARDELGEKYGIQLSAIGQRLDSAGVEAVERLIFTQKPKDSIRKVCEQEGCDAVLLSNQAKRMERILILVKNLDGAEKLASCVRKLSEAGVEDVTVLHVIKKEKDRKKAERMVDTFRRMLIHGNDLPGIPDVRVEVSNNFLKEIVRCTGEYDAVIMREDKQTFWNTTFGDLSEKIAKRTGKSVLFIKRGDNTP